MLKNGFILTTVFLLSSTLLTKEAPKKRYQSLNEFVATPLRTSEATYFYFNVSASGRFPNQITLTLQNEIFTDGVVLFDKYYTESSIDIVKYDNKYNGAENFISLRVNKININDIVCYDNPIFYSETSVKVLNEDKECVSESTNLVFKDGLYSWKKERLIFEGFDDCYVADFYHKLDPSIFKIRQDSDFTETLNLTKASLFISNRDGVFDNLPSSGKYAQINMDIEKIDGNYQFKFVNDLYVDPITLKMSSTIRDGYVKTNYLYLPRDEMRFEDEYQCYISLEGIGIDYNDIIFSFSLKSLLNTIGDCHNSEYCVIQKETIL